MLCSTISQCSTNMPWKDQISLTWNAWQWTVERKANSRKQLMVWVQVNGTTVQRVRESQSSICRVTQMKLQQTVKNKQTNCNSICQTVYLVQNNSWACTHGAQLSAGSARMQQKTSALGKPDADLFITRTDRRKPDKVTVPSWKLGNTGVCWIQRITFAAETDAALRRAVTAGRTDRQTHQQTDIHTQTPTTTIPSLLVKRQR